MQKRGETDMMIRKSIGQTCRHILALGIGLVAVFPMLWMVLSAFKTKEAVMDSGQIFPTEWQWQNFVSVILESQIPRYVVNSLFVAVCVVLLQVISGALFAYALVFFEFKGKNVLFAIVMATHMLPTAATYIPCYIILAKLHMLNTYQGLILSNTVSMFGIFLLRQAFKQIPQGMVDAARIDGASEGTILKNVVLPMAKPSFVTFILLGFVNTYNSYMWPSLITDSPELSMVSQGLRRFLIEGGAYGTQWQLVMAAGTVVVVPLMILFISMQKQIMAGITDTGSKG